MPSKLDLYAQMADHTAKQITSSLGEWTAFLETAGRLYKYPFHEQLMIFAQKPNATACADYDLWNKQMRRYVRRGTKGIALIDTSGDNPRLKYVFDVSDTGGRDNSRRPFLWEYRDEHQDAVTAALEQRYDISGKKGLADQLEQIASQLVNEYWNDNSHDILGILADSFLEEYDDYNVGVAFKNAAIVSTTYTLMSRCGLNPGDYLEHEDFLSVFDFNTRDTIAALGSVISNTSEQILRQIEITIKNYEREASLQQQAERTNDYAEQPELHAGRGLSDPEPDLERDRSEAPGQVRSDAEAVPAGAQTGAVEQHDPVGDPVSPSEGDRRDGEPEAGAADARTDEEERRDGGSKSQRPNEVGGLDEQSEGAGRGDDSDRADLQLNTSQQLTLFDLAMFPSEQEQMIFIDEAESVTPTPFAFSFAQEDIDLVLRVGSNERDARMVVASEFEKQKSVAEIAATLREQYRGGAGFKTDHGEFSAWYGEDGIRLGRGRSSRYARNAQVISWESAAERIGQLMEQGQYATNVEVVEAESHERTHLAEALLYHYGDMSEAAREQGFMPSLKDCRKGGFPDGTERMAEQLKDPAFRQQLSEELTAFAAAYEQDRSLMRFRLYNPQRVLDELTDYSLPRREYASDMTEVNQPDMFITDDEIDATIARGNIEGIKGRIYAYFSEAHNAKEKSDFLKSEYGTGGSSHAVSRSGWEDHSAKGMKLQKRGCADVELPWKKVVPRIENMIRNDRYFTPEERVQYEEMQTREWQFTQNVNAYNDIKHDHPDNIVLFQVGDFFEIYGEDAKAAARELDLTLTSRAVLGVGRVEMCGVPANRLDEFVEKLRQTHSVTISPLNTVINEHLSYSMAKLEQPEAEVAEPVLSAETGANAPVPEGNAEEPKPTIRELFDRYKPVIKDAISEDMPYRNACGHSDHENAVIEGNAAIRRAVLNSGDMELIRLYADVPVFRNRMHKEAIDETYPKLHELLRPLSQDDIDDALRAWNGDMDSKRAVVRYMNDHARDKGTAAWLSREYGGEESKSLFIVRAGSPEETELPWTKVQRRIAQLIKAEKFFTEAEYDNFEHIDPVVLRERLAERGIVNGEIVDEEKHNNSPFIQQVMADVERVYAEENLIPGETTFTHNGQTYMVDKVNFDTGTVLYQNIGFTLPEGEELFQSAPISTVRMYMEMEEAKPAQPQEQKPLSETLELPYQVGDTVYLDDTAFVIRNIDKFDVQLQDPTLAYPIFRAESKERFLNLLRQDGRNQLILDREETQPQFTTETVAVYGAEENHLPYDVVIQTIRTSEPEIDPPTPTGNPVSIPIDGEWTEFPDAQTAEQAAYEEYKADIRRNAQNFHIDDDHLGEGGPKTKFQANVNAIKLLKELETTGSQALPEQQEVLSRYVGWGGLADAFDPEKENWSKEYAELKELLTPEEYAAARSSTLNAHYTSPTVIKAIYEAVGNIGFETSNILEPAMGVGNFFGCLPESMQNSKLYGVELDSITGRIAQQLYPKADITVAGFETTDRRDFYDIAIGNVPFGQYQVNDRAYNKLGFSIHDYFFAKALDQVRPGGVVAFVTSRYTMDKQTPDVRKYIAQRAELLGAIRLPNDAFKANAGTEVVSDIIFLQKRDHPIEIEPDWVHLGKNEHGFSINSYFIEHPDMILGNEASESTQYGKQDFTVEPYDGVELSTLLNYAIQNIKGTYKEAELPDLGEGEAIDTSIPADPNVKNYSYTVVDGEVYYRENSRMVKPDLNATAKERVKGMVELRDCVQKLINQQMDGYVPDAAIRQTQHELNELYDKFTAKHGLINSRGNALAFADDSSYYLLCSLEVLDEDNNLKRKADMFTKRTIKPHEVVTSVDTASEALALSISEKACVDMEYMSQLTGKTEQELADDLRGVIYMDFNRRPDGSYTWRTADDFLSGNVREKLTYYTKALDYTQGTDKYEYMLANVEALRAAQPKDLDASEIEVRLGATWIDKDYIQQFMQETFDPPYYLRRSIQVNYSPFSAEWNITGKSQPSYSDVNAYMTYGTDRANAYKILEDTLNLRDVRIYDTVTDPDGKERRVLNSKETTLAQQKQQAIKDAFQDWIWRDPDRRQELVAKYNELFNSNRPREYDGSHITFSGMNPEIQLREHQLNAVAHILYGGNTLLAHEVGAGKTFEMVAAAMESKRLGLCQKPLFVVPNHLTEQWASEFLRLYPSANILAATKKDFEPRNRKKFCGRIATGDYDAIIIGHSQFERIPVSQERQEKLLQEQIAEVEEGLEELKASRAERFTIKSLERTKKSLETRLKKLQDTTRKDDVITFEQLGVDRLYVDEAHAFKNRAKRCA